MPSLTLRSVSIDFPVYGARAASLKQTLVAAATGGQIGYGTNVTVIRALQGISLDLRDGDRLGLVGHNGAGKTTLLRTLAGAYPPSQGTYSRSGSIGSLTDPMLGIEADATGYENIALRGLILGIDRQTMRSVTDEVAEFSGLGDYLRMPVRTYSTGMMMRLAFSIVTSFRSDILLMDEWMSVGDAEFRERAEARLREVVSQAGILVLASHAPGLIERECNMVMELSHGIGTLRGRAPLPGDASGPG